MKVLFLGDLKPTEREITRLNEAGVTEVVIDQGADFDASRDRILASDFVIANNIDLNQFVEELGQV